MEFENISKTTKLAVVGSTILTTGAVIASWPATVFLLQYFTDVQKTGALSVGSVFSILAAVLWGSASWSWFKIFRTRKS